MWFGTQDHSLLVQLALACVFVFVIWPIIKKFNAWMTGARPRKSSHKDP
jgi:predicted PurR-regulated permease PerM